MAIDIRATVTCSLGTLISASISDDYVQGTGLIKCKGSCELSGIVTPDVGTAVTFSYTQDGVTRQVPRKLRVLSSFADPFRRTTKVELGCKLTYLQDLQEPVDWTPFDDILNNDFTVDDAKIVTIPIHASSVMDKCLTELGITADTNPLTNKFSIARFDFGPGYVNVLSDLLVSESYCAYLNKDEELKVFSLDEKGGTGPVIEAAQIIDLGSIGVGQLPGEAVVVSYSTLKLNPPEAGSTGTVNWEEIETIDIKDPLPVPYGTNQIRTFTGREVVTEVREYETISLATAVSTGSWYYWQSLDQFRDVVTKVTKTVTSPSAYVETKRVVELLNNGVAYANTDIVSSQTVETTTYAMTTAEPLRTETLRYEDRRVAYSRLGLQLVYSASDYVNPSGLVLVGKTVVEYERSGDFTKTITSQYVWAPERQVGSQAAAEARDVFADATEVAAYLGSIEGVLVHVDTTVSTTQRGVTTYEGRPNGAERTNAANASGGDPNNGWRTESTAELELALGSATAQRRIEFSLPYAPDDTFTKAGSPPTYGSTASDAAEKASRYGRCQNRLLLGNRSGMNLQVEAKRMPSAPFKPIVVKANGLSALYRTNGTSWQMDASGILASTDALFWGAVGGTGTFWFPVAPGITTLPSEPAVVDGEMTVTSTVPVWNETVKAEGRLRLGVGVQSLAYALSLLTEPAAIAVRTALTARRIRKVEPPAIAVTVAALTPGVSSGASVRPAATDFSIAAGTPAVSGGGSVQVGLIAYEQLGFEPAYVGKAATIVQVEDGVTPALGVGATAPAISAGKAMLPPAADVNIAGAAPAVNPQAPTFVTFGAGVGSISGIIYSWPAGYQENDIALLVIEAGASDVSSTVPSGWEAVPGTPVINTPIDSTGSNLQLWWKRATASEGTVTISDGGDHQAAAMFIFRGCPTTGNPWDVIGTSTKDTASATATVPSVTTTVSNALVAMITGRPDDNSSSVHFSNPVNANLTSLTERMEYGTTAGAGGGFVLHTGIKQTPGSTGTTTITKTSSTKDTHIVVALRSY